MSTRSIIVLLLAWSTALTMSIPAIAVDDLLVGVWTATLDKPEGRWLLNFHVARDGTYCTTYSGPAAVPPEFGRIVSSHGAWAITTVTGREDRGAFDLHGDDLEMVGSSGERLTWHRSPQPAQGSFSATSPQLAIVRPPLMDERLGARFTGAAGGGENKRLGAGGSLGGVVSGLSSAMGSGTLSDIAQGALSNLANKAVQQVTAKVPAVRNMAGGNLGNVVPGAGYAGVVSGNLPMAGGGAGAMRAGMPNPVAALTSALPVGGSVEQILTSDFPLPGGGDDAQQFCIPELQQIANGGMVRRRFRTIK